MEFSREGNLTEDTFLGPLFRQLRYHTAAFFIGSTASRCSDKMPALGEIGLERGAEIKFFFSSKFYNVLLCNTPNFPTSYLRRLRLVQFTALSNIIIAIFVLLLLSRLQIVSDHVDKMISGEDFERTIQNFDSNFSLHLMDLMEKLSHYSTIDCEHQMLNIIARLDHNGYYTAQLEKKAAEGETDSSLLITL